MLTKEYLKRVTKAAAGHHLCMGEASDIYNAASGHAFELIYYAFSLGFKRGRAVGKREARK